MPAIRAFPATTLMCKSHATKGRSDVVTSNVTFTATILKHSSIISDVFTDLPKSQTPDSSGTVSNQLTTIITATQMEKGIGIGTKSSILPQQSSEEYASAVMAPGSSSRPAKPAADVAEPEFSVNKCKIESLIRLISGTQNASNDKYLIPMEI